MRLLPDVQLGPSALEFFGRTCNQFVTFEGGYADWDDAHIPRTGAPVRFVRGRVEPFGVRWGLRNRYAFTPSRISR